MKQIILILLLIFAKVTFSAAQDTLILKSGDTSKAYMLETTSLSDSDLYNMGQADASKYYKAKFSGTFLTTALINPVIGLIPAIAGSGTPPKDYNLNYPSIVLMKNEHYRRGYTLRARKMKQSKIWTNFGIGTGVYAMFVTISILNSE